MKEGARTRTSGRSHQGNPARDLSSGGHCGEGALLRATFECLDDAVFVVEMPARTLNDCNPAAERMFGYTREEIVGGNAAFLHVDSAAYEQFGRDLSRALGAHGVFRTEFRMRRKNGELFPSEHCVTQIVGARGCRTHIVSLVRDITERKRAEDELERTTRQLRLLHARLAETQEHERENLARDLHDTIGTELSALGLSLGAARLLLRKDEVAAAPETLARAERQVEQITRAVREFIAELRPGTLEDYGLIVAVRAIAERIANQTGVSIQVDGQEGARFAKGIETALYRIVQEALTNVAKHAQATRVHVALKPCAGGLRISIRDNGRGFDPHEASGPTTKGGIGLIGMRERAAAIGARFRVCSTPGKGTEVVVEVSREDSHR